jgi:hypothetical protein
VLMEESHQQRAGFAGNLRHGGDKVVMIGV